MSYLWIPRIVCAVALLGAYLLVGCSEEQQHVGLAAERTYVDLLYALDRENAAESQAAAASFNHNIRELRLHWYRPMDEDRIDDMRYHVDQAECAYDDALASIEHGQLDVAVVQLDRAVCELEAGDAASLHELYVGSIYDFIGAWMDITYLVRNSEQCDFEWEEMASCGRDARRAWRSVKGGRPTAYLYDGGYYDTDAFDVAHRELDERVEQFYRSLRLRDRCLSREEASRVNEAMWELLRLFGSEAADPEAAAL